MEFFMKAPALIVLIAIGCVSALSVTARSDSTGRFAEPYNAAEVVRIRAHLQRVENELRAADVSHLSPRQQSNRARHIAELARYRGRGVFPHNHVVSDRRVPVFIDEHGTHCAVGHLIAKSGHAQLSRRIAGERNLARVRELSDEPELVAWLDEAGLSLAEAARIQPYYGPTIDETRYPLLTGAAAGLVTGVTVLNLMVDREGGAWWLPAALAFTSGAAAGTVALAAHRADRPNDDISQRLIRTNIAFGVLGGLVGTRTLILGRADKARVGDNQGAAPGALQLSLAPWTSPRDGVGAAVRLRF